MVVPVQSAIYWVIFGPSGDSGPSGKRPAVVIQHAASALTKAFGLGAFCMAWGGCVLSIRPRWKLWRTLINQLFRFKADL